jgi:hypothetical protein
LQAFYGRQFVFGLEAIPDDQFADLSSFWVAKGNQPVSQSAHRTNDGQLVHQNERSSFENRFGLMSEHGSSITSEIFRPGARGHMLKSDYPRELVTAMRLVNNKQQFRSQKFPHSQVGQSNLRLNRPQTPMCGGSSTACADEDAKRFPSPIRETICAREVPIMSAQLSPTLS